MARTRPLEILLVEDSPEDVDLTREALQQQGIEHMLYVVQDGIEAMRYLKKMSPYAHNPVPDVIILDLNLPKKSGFEVLQDIQMDAQLQQIPIVILTTSDLSESIQRIHGISSRTYIKKSLGLHKLIEFLKECSGRL